MNSILCHIEAAVRAGVDRSDDLYCYMQLPFTPVPGIHLIPLKGDSFRKVEDVYWSEEKGFEVFFEFDSSTTARALQVLGWQKDK